jgi:hypothetical protein
VTIYDQITAMPRAHRLALAGWILRGIRLGHEDKCRLMGRLPRIDQERERKGSNDMMKVRNDGHGKLTEQRGHNYAVPDIAGPT